MLFLACDNKTFVPSITDCSETPTYTGMMQDVVDRNCSYSGCHDVGALDIGDYTSYLGLSEHFDSKIEDRVIVKQDMPLGVSMTEEDLKLFECWVQAGFPEN